LKNNYPNPFNPSTNIPYSLSIENFITIAVYDLIGNKVKLLVSDYKDIGNYTVNWNGVNEKGVSVPAGLYLFSIEVDEFRQTKKMILLK
jgi:flagellar hook assembly protein FlgD